MDKDEFIKQWKNSHRKQLEAQGKIEARAKAEQRELDNAARVERKIARYKAAMLRRDTKVERKEQAKLKAKEKREEKARLRKEAYDSREWNGVVMMGNQVLAYKESSPEEIAMVREYWKQRQIRENL